MDAIYFNDALKISVSEINSTFDLPKPVYIIRDIIGKIRLVVDGDMSHVLQKFSERLSSVLGKYSPGAENIIILKNDMMIPGIVFDSNELIAVGEGIFLLDRQVVGQDWLKAPLERELPVNRATFFGIKGGVGRSTALSVWAWHLAKRGKKVLVLDFDLESPGVGNTLLPVDRYPDYGIVDWFVENNNDNIDENFLDDMVSTSPLSDELDGNIFVSPASGIDVNFYPSKLSRVYLGVSSPTDTDSFAGHVEKMILSLESHFEPDVTIIDSRAGIHDIGAVSITRLNAQCFLFAINSQQTWHAYNLLFKYWSGHQGIVSYRDRLKMVASMVPEIESSSYIKSFIDSSYKLWSENLYEEADATGDFFNYDLMVEDAPHYPIHALWNSRFIDFNPIQNKEILSNDFINAYYGDFLSSATYLVTGEE